MAHNGATRLNLTSCVKRRWVGVTLTITRKMQSLPRPPPRGSRPTSKRRFKRLAPISDLSPTKTTRDPLGKVPKKRPTRKRRQTRP